MTTPVITKPNLHAKGKSKHGDYYFRSGSHSGYRGGVS